MITEEGLVKLGFEIVKHPDCVLYQKEYNYYMENKHAVSISEFTDDSFPQFLGSYQVRLGGSLLKSVCRDIEDIIAIDECFTKIQCKKIL